MILVDDRIGSVELLPIIKRIGVPCEKLHLEFGDTCFEGNGRNGPVTIGVERKALHDMLQSIDTSRYTAHQLPGMMANYDYSFLIVEGLWFPHSVDGTLMEGFKGGQSWGPCRYRSQRVAYSKLRRYLFSIQLSGVNVIFTRDIFQTAYDMCELYHYWQKKWGDHTALLGKQQQLLPSLEVDVPLVRRWAAEIKGIGTKLSEVVARQFKTPIRLAQADEVELLHVPGVGVKSAQSIVREIRGIK